MDPDILMLLEQSAHLVLFERLLQFRCLHHVPVKIYEAAGSAL